MTAVRRIYIYLVTFAALTTLGLGVANLLRALLEAWVSTTSAASPGYLQDQVSLWGAAALVGLPVWFVHWSWAQRLSRDVAERSSPLRRLFLYGVLAGSVLTAWIALDEILSGVANAVSGTSVSLARVAIPPLPLVGVAAGVWLYHWRVAAADRDAVGETGASATLRRWYVYGFAWSGLLALLFGAQTVLMDTLLRMTTGPAGYGQAVPGLSDALIGLAVWSMHWIWLPRRLDPTSQQEDQRSTLRSVYLFLGLAVVVLGTLVGISQALYYALARLLGISTPGGVGGSLLEAAAGPVSVAIVYGVGWWYQRAVIGRSARELEIPRQVGVRRIYEYLTALVALTVLSVGLAGLLWMLGDALTQAPNTVGADWWRDRLSLFATLTIVGLPVWLLHWRPRAGADAQSLARRIYLYTALIGSMLALLGSGAVAVYRLLSIALGSASPDVRVDLSHALAVGIVAAGIAAYHWRMIRKDMEQRVPAAAVTESARVIVELAAPTQTAIDAALQLLRDQGVTVRHRTA
jgi:Domain of unknown function (DUF5671)